MFCYNFSMNFREAEEKYRKFKELYEEGIISGEEFKKEVKKLLVRDEEGRLWTIGIKSGAWYVMTDSGWERAEPPQEKEEEKTRKDIALSDIIEEGEEETICPVCGKEVEPYFTFCPYCGARLKEVEEEEAVERPFILKAISPLSFGLLFAGLGFLLGAALGGVFGGDPYFLAPSDPFSIGRGGVWPAFFYGLMGGFLGFLSLFVAGAIFSLLVNLCLVVFGGLKLYFK